MVTHVYLMWYGDKESPKLIRDQIQSDANQFKKVKDPNLKKNSNVKYETLKQFGARTIRI